MDRGEKMRIYAQVLKVGEYFLFDPLTGVLEGYDLDAPRNVYVRKEPDTRGLLSCAPMNLSLGKAQGTYHGREGAWLRWFGPDGATLETGAERADAEAERVRLHQEELSALKTNR